MRNSPLQRGGDVGHNTGTQRAAHAEGLPGMRGHDHTGITVPDMKEAVTSSSTSGMSEGDVVRGRSEFKGTFMKDALDVNPRAVITQSR